MTSVECASAPCGMAGVRRNRPEMERAGAEGPARGTTRGAPATSWRGFWNAPGTGRGWQPRPPPPGPPGGVPRPHARGPRLRAAGPETPGAAAQMRRGIIVEIGGDRCPNVKSGFGSKGSQVQILSPRHSRPLIFEGFPSGSAAFFLLPSRIRGGWRVWLGSRPRNDRSPVDPGPHTVTTLSAPRVRCAISRMLLTCPTSSFFVNSKTSRQVTHSR